MVTANGFPKSGNHALVKAMQLLCIDCQIHHLPFGSPVAEKYVFIKRDPRNVLCSWLRFNGQEVTPTRFLGAFRRFQTRPLIEELADYEGWLTDRKTLIVRYEDLISDNTEMSRIAGFIEVPYVDGAFEELPGMTRTWFDNHSNFMNIWTPEVAAVWADEGGNELLKRWGY